MDSHRIAEKQAARADAALPKESWSVDVFATFWSHPVASRDRIPPLIAGDIVGYWPGGAKPVHGAQGYWQYIVELLTLVPDLRLEVIAHSASGERQFILWEARGTGPEGPLACAGCDCVRVREGIVVENRIFCDHPIFRTLASRVANA